MRHWFPSQGTANNNILYICILLPLAESTLKKTAESGRKFSCFFKIRSVLNVFILKANLLPKNTARDHLAVYVYSENVQMSSKRIKTKEVPCEPQASSQTGVGTTFSLPRCVMKDHTHG